MPTSLTERIRSINRMNGATPIREEENEERLEQSMVEAVEQSWEEAKAEPQATINEPVTLEMLYLEIQALKQTIAQQADELKKINKHINATQKMLKKGVKK